MCKFVLIFAVIFLPAASSNAETASDFQKALRAFIDGKYDLADASLTMMQTQVDSDSEHGQIWYLKGRFDAWRGEPDQAFEWFEKAVEVDRDEANYHYWLGLMYGSKAQRASYFRKPGHARNSLKSFEKAVECDPDHMDARRRLVDYHVRAPGILGGSKDEARRQADQIKSRNDVLGHLAWAAIHRNKKAIEAEEAAYRAAYEAGSDEPIVIIRLGDFLNRNKRRSEAITLCESYLNAYPDQGRIVHYFGSLLRLEKQYSRAYEIVYRNAEQFRDSLDVLEKRADVRAFERALILQSRRRSALYLIGFLAADLGENLDHGLAAVDEVLKLAPSTAKSARANGHYLRGRIYKHKGQMNLAREAFRTALEWNKKHTAAKKALEGL